MIFFVLDESRMRWIAHFTSAGNRHVLPLFTSLLNVVCSYDPIGYGLPYNYLLFSDSREPLVQASLQVLIVCLDNDCVLKEKVSILLSITLSFVVILRIFYKVAFLKNCSNLLE